MRYYVKNPRLSLKKLKINVSYALFKLMEGNKKVMKLIPKVIKGNTKAGTDCWKTRLLLLRYTIPTAFPFLRDFSSNH